MYPAFFYALRKPPAGRVGGVSHTPSTLPRYMGRIRVPRVQTPFKRHLNSVLRAVGEGHQGCLPSWPGTSGTRAKLAGGIRDACQVGRVHQTRTRLSSSASADARRLPQTPRGSVHQKRELAPPPPLDPPPQEPPLELPPRLHEELLLSSLEILPEPPLVKYCLKSFSSLTWPHLVQT